MKKLIAGMLVAGLIIVSGTSAEAAPIVPNCGTCGADDTWNLTLKPIHGAERLNGLTAPATFGTPKDLVPVTGGAPRIARFVDLSANTATVADPAEPPAPPKPTREPAALLFFGAALAAAAMVIRRLQKASSAKVTQLKESGLSS